MAAQPDPEFRSHETRIVRAAAALGVAALAIVVGLFAFGQTPTPPPRSTAAGDAAPRGGETAGTPPRTPAADRSQVPVVGGQPASVRREASSVVGRVLDGLRLPLADAEVTLAPTPEGRWLCEDVTAVRTRTFVRTGRDGRFRARPAERGPLTLLVRHPKFPPTVVTAALRTRPDEAIDLGDIVLRSEVGLVVRIEDRSGLPIAGARASLEPALADLWLEGADSVGRAALSDSQGLAVFYGVVAGPYRLRVEAGGHATRELAVAHESRSDGPLLVQLEPGEVLRGRVLDADGMPLDDAAVYARASTDGLETMDVTTPRGQFRLPGLRPGRYELVVDTVSAGTLGRADVMVPQVDRLFEIRLERPRAIAGRLLPAAGSAPVGAATVLAAPAEGGPLVRRGRVFRPTAMADDEGRFRIEGLPPGRFFLVVSSNDTILARHGPVEASPTPESIEIPVAALVPLTGRVVDREGHPLENTILEVMPDDYDGTALAEFELRAVGHAAVATAQTDADGRFELACAAGRRHRLLVRAAGHPVFLTGPFAAGGAATAAGPRSGTSLDEIRVPAGAYVTGTAFDADGRPARWAKVCVDPLPDGAPAWSHGSSVSDEHGNFTVGPLADGTYRMFYYFPERQDAIEIAESHSRTSVRIRLEEGTTTRQNLGLR